MKEPTKFLQQVREHLKGHGLLKAVEIKKSRKSHIIITHLKEETVELDVCRHFNSFLAASTPFKFFLGADPRKDQFIERRKNLGELLNLYSKYLNDFKIQTKPPNSIRFIKSI